MMIDGSVGWELPSGCTEDVVPHLGVRRVVQI